MIALPCTERPFAAVEDREENLFTLSEMVQHAIESVYHVLVAARLASRGRVQETRELFSTARYGYVLRHARLACGYPMSQFRPARHYLHAQIGSSRFVFRFSVHRLLGAGCDDIRFIRRNLSFKRDLNEYSSHPAPRRPMHGETKDRIGSNNLCM